MHRDALVLWIHHDDIGWKLEVRPRFKGIQFQGSGVIVGEVGFEICMVAHSFSYVGISISLSTGNMKLYQTVDRWTWIRSSSNVVQSFLSYCLQSSSTQFSFFRTAGKHARAVSSVWNHSGPVGFEDWTISRDRIQRHDSFDQGGGAGRGGESNPSGMVMVVVVCNNFLFSVHNYRRTDRTYLWKLNQKMVCQCITVHSWRCIQANLKAPHEKIWKTTWESGSDLGLQRLLQDIFWWSVVYKGDWEAIKVVRTLSFACRSFFHAFKLTSMIFPRVLEKISCCDVKVLPLPTITSLHEWLSISSWWWASKTAGTKSMAIFLVLFQIAQHAPASSYLELQVSKTESNCEKFVHLNCRVGGLLAKDFEAFLRQSGAWDALIAGGLKSSG